MRRATVEAYPPSGQKHAWIFDPTSVQSMLLTLRAIRQARHTPGMGLDRITADAAMDDVRRVTLQRVGPLKAFYQLFVDPAAHDAAIVELTGGGE